MTTAVLAPSVTIREAHTADRDRLLALLVSLAHVSTYTVAGHVNESYLASALDTMLSNPQAGFFVVDDGGALVGILVLLLYRDLLSGDWCAAEVCWYVDPPYRDGTGVTLLAHGETWARSHGARRLQMLSPEAKFGRWYQRHGYRATDQSFVKDLTCHS